MKHGLHWYQRYYSGVVWREKSLNLAFNVSAPLHQIFRLWRPQNQRLLLSQWHSSRAGKSSYSLHQLCWQWTLSRQLQIHPGKLCHLPNEHRQKHNTLAGDSETISSGFLKKLGCFWKCEWLFLSVQQYCVCKEDCSTSICMCGQLSLRCWYDKVKHNFFIVKAECPLYLWDILTQRTPDTIRLHPSFYPLHTSLISKHKCWKRENCILSRPRSWT